jgi:nucleotide-binding universal stress UspA family protein
MAFHTILAPLDGSPLGECALPYATTLARCTNSRLVLVHAASDATSRRQAEASLAQIAKDLWQHGVAVESHVRAQSPGPLIVDAAETWEADLVAMSTHGRSGWGRWLYGSVADHVLRHAAAPVLLVSAQCDRNWPPASGSALTTVTRRVLLPLDGSRRAEAALGPACALAVALAARLHLVQVVPPPPPPLYLYGESVADEPFSYSAYPAGEARPLQGAIRPLGTYRQHRPGGWYAWDSGLGEQLPLQEEPADTSDLEHAGKYLDRLVSEIKAGGRTHGMVKGLAVDVDAIVGRPATAIISLDEQRDVAAIAMSTHGRSGVARLALGSVATEILQRTQVPLLLVGPVAAARLVPSTEQPEAADGAASRDEAGSTASRE